MSLGTLVVSLAANTAAFSSDLGKAAHEADARMKSMSDGAAKAGRAIGVAIGAATASLVAMTKVAINNADAMTKMAQSTGISVESLSELSFAAKLAGVSSEALATSIGRLNRNMVEAASGTGDAARAFDALGISVKNNDGTLKKSEQVMSEVANKFAGMEDGASKSALAMMIFGKAGAQMIPMLNKGADELQRARDEARAFGLTLDTETGRAAEQFNDNLSRMVGFTQGVANSVMKSLLPEMNKLTDAMVSAAKSGEAFELVGKGAVIAFQTIAVVVANVIYVLKQTGIEIGGIAAQLAALAKLDWKSFQFIRKEMVDDAKKARAELDAFEARIMSIGKTAQITGTYLEDVWNVGKVSGPVVKSAQEIAEAKRKEEAAVRAAQKAHQDWMNTLAEAANTRARMNEELEKASEAQGEAEFKKAEEERIKREEEYLRQREIEIERENEMLREAFELRMRYQTELQKFTAMSWQNQAKSVVGSLVAMTAGVAQHSRAMFQLNKLAGIANAIINTAEGVTLALAKYPPPLSFAMAAAQLAAGTVQINAIRSASFGGGGVAPSVVGSTPAPPVSPVESAPTRSAPETRVIIMSSNPMQRQFLEELADSFKELAADGYPMPFELAEAR